MQSRADWALISMTLKSRAGSHACSLTCELPAVTAASFVLVPSLGMLAALLPCSMVQPCGVHEHEEVLLRLCAHAALITAAHG